MIKKGRKKCLPGKIELFGKLVNFAWKYQNFSEICMEKLGFVLPGSTTPQISNQTDAIECNVIFLNI